MDYPHESKEEKQQGPPPPPRTAAVAPRGPRPFMQQHYSYIPEVVHHMSRVPGTRNFEVTFRWNFKQHSSMDDYDYDYDYEYDYDHDHDGQYQHGGYGFPTRRRSMPPPPHAPFKSVVDVGQEWQQQPKYREPPPMTYHHQYGPHPCMNSHQHHLRRHHGRSYEYECPRGSHPSGHYYYR